MRNSRLAGAALAAALAAGCGRKPPAPASAAEAADGAALAAPAPSSTVVTSPLGSGASDYTNDMQVQNLRDQAAALGISGLSKPSVQSEGGDDEPRRTMTYQEGVERTLDMAQEAEAARHAIEGDKNKSVALPTAVPGIPPANKEGAPIGDDAGAGPKDP